MQFRIAGKLSDPSNAGECLLKVAEGKKPLISVEVLKLDDADDLAVLVHELEHSLDFIEQTIEGKLDPETRAYLLQGMFKQILKKMKLKVRKD